MACTTLLGQALFGPTVGLLSGLLLLTTVGFWGYGEVAYPYVALAGETAIAGTADPHGPARSPARGHWPGRGVGGLAGRALGWRRLLRPAGLWALWAVSWRLRLLRPSGSRR